MTERSWRITVFDLKARQECRLPPATLSFLFVPTGEALVSSDGEQQRVGAEAGAFLNGGDRVTAGEGAWLFQVGGDERVYLDEALTPVLSRRIRPIADPVIVRADRIDQPAGMTTPSHHHRGPGIRRLLTGKLLAEVGDHVDLITPGQAWFESGREPVVGTNLNEGTNTFIRMMILPAELEGGKSSFVPTTPADAARPRGVTPQVFGERGI
jgi:hypothetical protein